ncbi:MAG: class I SAM-dependent methyltransferase [Gemmataceae bacterium]
MLQRQLETEVMDSPEEARDYDSMDHVAVNQQFVADFLHRWDGESPILDVGTGTAQIPIELCRKDPAPQVTGVDLSREMLKVGEANVDAAGLADRIKLEHVDAKGLPYPDESFAAVMSNSIVHHIPEPKAAMAEMIRVCRHGGLLFLRDLLRPDAEEELRHLVNTYANGANEHQRKLFSDSLRAALSLDEVKAIVEELGFNGARVKATSDRHWTWATKK